jgi:serine protease Do
MRAWFAVTAAVQLLAGEAAAQESRPQPVSLAKIVAEIPVGTPWEHYQAQGIVGCHDLHLLTWEAKNNGPLKNPELERVFRAELSQTGFVVAGDPTNLFEADSKAADLQVGARITEIKATLCETATFSDELSRPSAEWPFKGAASMKVEWQVYSVSQAKVLARIPTDASFEQPKSIPGGSSIILNNAFGANARALARSEAFKALVSAAPTKAASAEARTPIPIAVRSLAAMPLDRAAKGVVSIFAGDAMGSGVLISDEGYILTNHHVAGASARVRVRWPDGTDTVGEVIRGDRARDVALIRTTARAEPLPIRSGAVKLGEAVFAIGTPKEREFAGTLTKGVVSNPERVVDGQRFIQSDVAVDHGNSGGPLLDESGRVIGLTDWGYAPDGVSHNLNFFIPIDDALTALALTQTAAAEPAAAPKAPAVRRRR